MYGECTQPAALRCVVCGRWVAMRVDPEDVRRHLEDEMFVQDAFADRAGVPYLTPAEREMWVSGCCNECWTLLVPSDWLAYN